MQGTFRRGGSALLGLLAIVALVAVVHAPVAPVTLTVPFSYVPVADGDLDGNASTGAWSGAISVGLPLENGETGAYGSVELTAKHDGTFAYFRVLGTVDVPWTSAAGSHFWFGILVSATASGHHQAGQDGSFFGDSTYTSAPPLLPVDTHGGAKPPATDASQDDFGEMRVSGTSAPYEFTAEWKRKLSTGDPDDIAFVADGNTSYSLYATTDSNGGGSGGGALTHNAVTNENVIRFEVSKPPLTPPADIKVDHTPPRGVTPGSQSSVIAVLTNATAAVIEWRNSSMSADALVPMTNLSTPNGTGWVYAAWIPAQPVPTQIRYVLNASSADGYHRESFFFSVAYPAGSDLTPEEQHAWILTMVASLSMAASVVAVSYWYIGRRLNRGAT